MAGGANRAWTDEATLSDPRFDGDPRIVLLRNDCRVCGARRGQYCRTSGGYTTLHKSRGRKSMRPVPEQRPASRHADTGPDDAMVALIWARDQGRCACCDTVIPPGSPRNQEWCIAHRLLRAHGVDNSASNLYLSCGNPFWGCEYDTHRYPEKSYAAGRMVSFADVPAKVRMVHAVLGAVLLDDGGGYTRVEAEFIPAVEVSEPW